MSCFNSSGKKKEKKERKRDTQERDQKSEILGSPEAAGVSHDNQRAQTCTIDQPSKTPPKFHQKTPPPQKTE